MERSLWGILSWVTYAVAGVGVVALVALIAITSVLNLVSRDLSRAIESVRVADELEVALLLHNEARDPATEGAARAALVRAVEEAAGLIQSPEEQRQVGALRAAVIAYLSPGSGNAEAVTAFAATHRLSLLNVEHARASRERAERLDRMTNLGGAVVVVILVLCVAAFMYWLRHGPFQQIGKISNAMERFSAGELEARAPEAGPHELRVMSRTFNATAGALVRARQRQARYVATAVHDLRAPLTAIQLAIGYVTPERPLPSEQRLRELLALIGRQLTRMNGLVGDVLNGTWIEAGELPLSRGPLDLRASVAASVDLFRALAPEHTFELSIPSQPLVVDGDRARLEQVANNLLSNAVKYSPVASRVGVSLSRIGDEVVLEVSDEGPGIAPEEREEIFEAFHRRSASHGEAAGTSLGLWVSRRVVEAHDGHIELESRMGRGSTFRVLLPAAPAAPDERRADQKAT